MGCPAREYGQNQCKSLANLLKLKVLQYPKCTAMVIKPFDDFESLIDNLGEETFRLEDVTDNEIDL